MIRSSFVGLLALLSLSAVAEGVKVSERFGYDPADATANLQAALDSGLPEIVVDRKDGPWVVRPLFAKSNQKIVFEKGVVLYATRYQTPAASQDGVWELRLRLPKVGYPEDSSYELAGVQPLFFLSRDKYWLSK